MTEPNRPATDWLTRGLFLRALGLIYFIACASFGLQITGLIGSNGRHALRESTQD